MKLIKSTLLCAGIAAALPSVAANVNIANGQFDARELGDNGHTSMLYGWQRGYGRMGIFNPDHTVFPGEQGHGAHRNTLYLIDAAKVSQDFTFRTFEDTTFTLSFDIGQRADVGMQDYMVKVTAGDATLVEVFNPVRPDQRGAFKKVEVKFTNKDVVGELMQLTIETSGIGHIHLDNFDLQYEQTFKSPKASWRPVAYGRQYADDSGMHGYCLVEHSLAPNDNSYWQYMETSFYGPCYCYKSKLVMIDETDDTGGTNGFVMCVKSSED